LQQSHHCGIETAKNSELAPETVEMQQSHHCGIETNIQESRLENSGTGFGSNRTIVGLKRMMPYCMDELCRKQQSHHCGIETLRLQTRFRAKFTAAIAPLWD
jgi:hypothetical protein